jgi:hypothetical protein
MSDTAFITSHVEKNAPAAIFITAHVEKNACATVEERRFQRRVKHTKSRASAPVVAFLDADSSDSDASIEITIPFAAHMNYGIIICGNERPSICTNLRRDTAPTLPSNPPNRTPWNERPSLCI